MTNEVEVVTDSEKQLLKDFDPGETKRDFSTKTRICYNPQCPDYRKERPDYQDCGCKRTKIKGGSV